MTILAKLRAKIEEWERSASNFDQWREEALGRDRRIRLAAMAETVRQCASELRAILDQGEDDAPQGIAADLERLSNTARHERGVYNYEAAEDAERALAEFVALHLSTILAALSAAWEG